MTALTSIIPLLAEWSKHTYIRWDSRGIIMFGQNIRGKMLLVKLSGQVIRRKHGKGTIIRCRKSMKKKWREWSVFDTCKVSSIEREISTKGVMRAGQKMVRVHTTNIFREVTGIGRPIHHTEIKGLISGRLPGPVQAIHYHITIQSWVLTDSFQDKSKGVPPRSEPG